MIEISVVFTDEERTIINMLCAEAEIDDRRVLDEEANCLGREEFCGWLERKAAIRKEIRRKLDAANRDRKEKP